MYLQRLLLGALGTTVLAATSSAQTLADWDFSNLNYTGPTNNPVVNPILPMAECTVASGYSVTDLTAEKVMASYEGLNWFQHSGGGNYPGMAPLRRFDGDNSNPSTFHDGIVDNYVAFTLTAAAAGGLDISRLRVNTYRFGTGAPIEVGFEVSVDGAPASLFAPMQDDLNAGDSMPDWFEFDGAISGATSVEVRLIYTAAPGGTGTGPVFIAGIQVEGGSAPITAFCDPADINSTGFPTVMTGSFGSGVGSDLHLEATQGPPTQFGYFLIGTGSADPGTPISNGHLCLAVTGGNTFGRYNVSGVMNSVGQFDGAGVLQNMVGTSTVGTGFDVPSSIPSIGGTISAGSTWHFQLWHREAGGASNFSNGLTVNF